MVKVKLRLPYSFQKSLGLPQVIEALAHKVDKKVHIDTPGYEGVAPLIFDEEWNVRKNIRVLSDGLPLSSELEIAGGTTFVVVPVFGEENETAQS